MKRASIVAMSKKSTMSVGCVQTKGRIQSGGNVWEIKFACKLCDYTSTFQSTSKESRKLILVKKLHKKKCKGAKK